MRRIAYNDTSFALRLEYPSEWNANAISGVTVEIDDKSGDFVLSEDDCTLYTPTTLNAAVASGASSITLGTGAAVVKAGDRLSIASSTDGPREECEVQAYNSSTKVVTLVSKLAYGHASGAAVVGCFCEYALDTSTVADFPKGKEFIITWTPSAINAPGTHTGSDNASALADSTKTWPIDSLIGSVVYNSDDGSRATVTDNDAHTVTGTLSGGTRNKWYFSDHYTFSIDYGDFAEYQEDAVVYDGAISVADLTRRFTLRYPSVARMEEANLSLLESEARKDLELYIQRRGHELHTLKEPAAAESTLMALMAFMATRGAGENWQNEAAAYYEDFTRHLDLLCETPRWWDADEDDSEGETEDTVAVPSTLERNWM
jgi:hypothetical protein